MFSVCFTLFLSLYYFILFSSVFQYNHPHTRYLAGFCLLLCFVCFFVLKRELVFGFPYFCYFYLLVSFSYLNYQRSSSVLYFFYRFRSLFSCLDLARSQLLVHLLFPFPHHHHLIINIMLLLRRAEAAFSFSIIFLCDPRLPAHTYTT